MKRDAVFRALQPFDNAGVEVDFVQLSPLSIFNVVCRDQIDELPTAEEFDPEDPPESIVVLSICLLYTSPSPRDATLSRMPSSA